MRMQIHVVGRKNSGKTSFCEKLIQHLTEVRGLRVNVIKHSANAYPAEDGQRDTGKLRRAGASVSFFENRQDIVCIASSTDPMARRIREEIVSSCDVVVLEGDHHRSGRKIEVIPRGGWQHSYFAQGDADDIVAVICDEEPPIAVPRFHADAAGELVDWMIKNGY